MSNKLTHPKTVIFLGAGATAQLMPTTAGIAQFLTHLLLQPSKNKEALNINVKKALGENNRFAEAFTTLGVILGACGKKQKKAEIQLKADEYSFRYGNRNKVETIKENLYELGKYYDWECLQAIAQHSEKEEGKIDVMSLYSILDILIEKNAGFKSDKYYPHYRVVAARRLALLLTNLLLYVKTKEKLPENKTYYKKFFETLADLMGEEAINFSRKNIDFTSREFVLFSYAIISFNWDPVLLGMMFEAHKNYNHSPSVPYLGENALKLRLFNDFGIVIGSLRKEKDGEKEFLWFQGHESIAARVNDPDYPGRLMRVGKYLFPHGSSAFRICPVCQKTNFVVRGLSANNVDYYNFYGPQILPEFDDVPFEHKLLTNREKQAFSEGQFDVVECYECGHLMRTSDTPLIMQSAVKGRKPPLLEEAVFEMASLTKKAEHLVFLGYSMPQDDAIYKSIFASSIAENQEKKISIVSFGDSDKANGKIWHYDKEIEKLDTKDKDKYLNFKKLFNNERTKIRITYKGFPNILYQKNDYSSVKKAVIDLIYWR